jgi:hypothetical protein
MNKILVIVFLLFLSSCGEHNSNIPAVKSNSQQQTKIIKQKPTSEFEKECIISGLLDVHQLDTNIAVDMQQSL